MSLTRPFKIFTFGNEKPFLTIYALQIRLNVKNCIKIRKNVILSHFVFKKSNFGYMKILLTITV